MESNSIVVYGLYLINPDIIKCYIINTVLNVHLQFIIGKLIFQKLQFLSLGYIVIPTLNNMILFS